MKPDWYDLAKLLKDSPDVMIGLIDSDLNDVPRKYFFEGSIPNLKLFLRERKESPVPFKDERNLNAFLQFLAQNCSSSTPGKTIMAAQFQAYAGKHRLRKKLYPLLHRLIERIIEQKKERTANSPGARASMCTLQLPTFASAGPALSLLAAPTRRAISSSPPSPPPIQLPPSGDIRGDFSLEEAAINW